MHRFARSLSGARYICSVLALLASACGSDASDPVPSFMGPAASKPGELPATPAPGSTKPGDGQPPGSVGGNGDTPTDNLPLDMGGQQPPGSGSVGTTTPPTEDPPTEQTPGETPPEAVLERPTRGTTNLFTDLLGVPVGEVDQKVITAVNRFYGIGTNEQTQPPVANSGYRVYYELPQDRSMAYIWAVDANDIRSEGMSYGMMIAVQMDMQEQFDKLWKFARTFMQFPANSNLTAWRYYFRWQGSVNTSNAQNWQVNYMANTGPAPDGEEYFAAALYLANRRWGSDGGVNYLQDAQNLSSAMLNNQSAGGRTAVINGGSNMVVFFPSGGTANYSDPSYHLPAFYELFASDGPQQDAARWRQIANVSRGFFVSSANPTTGLHPDYANFDGTANSGGSNHNQFRFDAWRVIMNMAVDFSWFSSDARLKTQAEKYHAFFGSRIGNGSVVNQTFNLDGSGAGGGSSTALTATLAAGALASGAANRAEYVENLWNVPQQNGTYRYYQESVYLLGLLATSGLYGYEWAGEAPSAQ
jgi:oligosaccharide reducing-end xylanase